ncbi:GNAT family N-acetyltransferase [Azotobacter vinelandii]
MEIRPASAADIPALCHLLDQLFAQEAEFTPDREAQQRGLAAIIEDPRVGEILLAEEDGRPLGMVNLLYTISTALGTPVALLEDMVVDATARGRGLGTQLLEAAAATARRRGCRRITLLTDADNLDAQRFYARQGFARSPMIPPAPGARSAMTASTPQSIGP